MFTTGSEGCSNAPDFSELQDLSTYYYCLYGQAVYGNLSIGMIYGEGQETHRYSPKLSQCSLIMITGAYIVVYLTSVYVLL
jgi:hypothetical protein